MFTCLRIEENIKFMLKNVQNEKTKTLFTYAPRSEKIHDFMV